MSETPNTDQLVQLSNVRLSYFYGFEPFKDPDDPSKVSYCSHFILAPDHADVAKIKAAQRAAAIGMWKDGAEAVLEALAGQDRLCLHSGNVSKPGQDGYKGMLYVSGSSKKRFTIVDCDRTPLTQKDGRPYSGCYANAIVNIWAQNNKWGKRINCQIAGVQFLRHGESFGGGRVVDPTEFADVSAKGADGAVPAAAGAASGLF